MKYSSKLFLLVGSLPGFKIGTVMAIFHALGKYPKFIHWLKIIARFIHVELSVFLKTISGTPSTPLDLRLGLAFTAEPISAGDISLRFEPSASKFCEKMTIGVFVINSLSCRVLWTRM